MSDTDPTTPTDSDGYLASLIGGPMDMRVMFMSQPTPDIRIVVPGDQLAVYELIGTEHLAAITDTRAVNLATYQYVGTANRVSSVEGPADD